MYNILIVEDEELIRKSLIKTIQSNLPDCTVCGEAENAIEGIKKAKDLKPDIIITDICMNKMTGLEMIEEIKLFLPSVKMIVITGYRNFEYAHQAVNLNVFSLLLKPIQPQEMIRNIKNAIECIEEEKSKQAENEKLNALLMQNLPYIRQKILLDMIYGIASRNSLDSKEALLLNDINIHKFYLILFEIQDTQNKKDNKDMYLIQCDILYIVQQLVGHTDNFYHIFLDCEKFVVILKNDLNIYSEKLILSMGTKLIDKIKSKYEDIHINIGLSSQGNGGTSLYVKYQECKKALSYAKHIDNNIIVSYSSISSFEDINNIHYKLLELKNYLISAIDNYNSLEISNYLKKFTETIKCLANPDIKFIRRIYTQIFLHINELRQDLNATMQKDIPNNITNLETLIEKCDNFDDLNEVLKLSIDNIIKNNRKFNTETISKHVQKAIDYIHANYQKKITLEDVASHIFLSPVHTSRIFKKETGKNLIDYINEVKIKKAKKLLDNGEYKIYEVAQIVGFDNAHYFSTLFKKYTNKTATEYLKSKF